MTSSWCPVVPRAHAVVVMAALALASHAAHAELPATPGPVTLLVPEGPEPHLEALVNRVGAELDAAGLTMVKRIPGGSRSLIGELRSVPSEQSPIGLGFVETTTRLQVLIAARPEGADAGLWRIDSSPEEIALLAVRAVDAVRALLAGRPVEGERFEETNAAKSPPEPIAQPARVERAAPPDEPVVPRAGLHGVAALGLMALAPGQSLSPELGPVMSIAWQFRERWSCGLAAFWGLHAGREDQLPIGRVTVSTTLLSLELRRWFRPGRSFEPFVMVAAGGARLSFDADPGADFAAHPSARIVAMTRAGVGARVIVTGRVSVLGTLEATLLWPSVDLHLADREVGTLGRPALFATIGVDVKLP